MKVGILTFQASHNCGSMLQAFALQKVLERELNAEVEIIDYANKNSRNLYGFIDWRLNRKSLLRSFNNITHYNVVKQSRGEYEDFKKRYLVLSDKSLRNTKELAEYISKYDILIAGGDQVWNVKCTDAGKEYYLDFVHNIRKISYSPSLGGINILKYADDLSYYKSILQEFEKISVREPNGKKWLEELSGRDVTIVADPTLLLTQKEWEELLPVPEIEGKYIFNYAFYHNFEEVNEAIEHISKRTGMPVYILDHKSYSFYHLDKYGFFKYEKTGPLAMLGLMKNASLVMTQSFHGTLFSALFHRKFWSYNTEEYYYSDDDRATAILHQFGLDERYVKIQDLRDAPFLFDEIDYDSVDARIKLLRDHSLEYIRSI